MTTEPRSPREVRLVRALVPFLTWGLLVAQVVAAGTFRVEIGEGWVASMVDGRELFLEALPLPREGLLAFSKRFCGDEAAGDEAAASIVARANGGTRRLLAGVRYRVPYPTLRPEYQRKVILGLFAQDRGVEEGWRHTVQPSARGRESLWRIAEWFTGRGENYPAIRRHNRLPDEDIFPGQSLVIPKGLLLPALRSVVEELAAATAPTPATTQAPLRYAADSAGEYAVYNLGRGEALYSSVVVRFTGSIHAEDVNSLASEIARRSDIDDVTDIPVGYAIKIPLDLLRPEFLPMDHPRRRDYEAARTESARFINQVEARDLAGVTAILDAGHGGRDVGASVGGVWESIYVYDIMLRVKRILESTTAATVVPTVRDGDTFRIEDRERLSFSRGHTVLTTPPYPIEDSTVGVALRWYLANSVALAAKKRDGKAEKVVFVSLHADSLHPSLRGAMVYVPGLLKTPSDYGKRGPIFASRKEVREQPRVTMSRKQRVRSEGLSRDLASHVMKAFRDRGLPIHPNKPVRDRVIRRRREWVPAILRFNTVPAKVLVEVCNLANAKDRKLIQTRSFRQSVAEAVVEGILSYYGYSDSQPEVAVAGASQ